MPRIPWFKTNLNSFLAYETVKLVRIHDWRIGGLYWTLMSIIGVYVVGYEMLYQEGWRASTTATGLTRQGIDLAWNTTVPSYCLRDTEPPGSRLPSGVVKRPCVFLDDMEMVFNRGPGFMTVTTSINQTSQTRTCSPFNLSCTHGTHAPDGWWRTAPDTASTHTYKNPYYVAHAEDLQIWLDHALLAPDMFPDIHGNSRETSGKLVDQDGDTLREFTGVKDMLSLGDVMDAAAVSLDQYSDSVFHKSLGWTYRQSGAVIVLEIKYSNVRTNGELKYRVEAKRIKGLSVYVEEAIYPQYPTERVLLGRQGVLLLIQVTGNVGVFKFHLFLITLVAAFALTTMATMFVDMMALWVMPQREAYRECKYTSVEVQYESGDTGIFGEVGAVKTNPGRELVGRLEEADSTLVDHSGMDAEGQKDVPEPHEDVSLLLKGEEYADSDVDPSKLLNKDHRNCFNN